MPPITGSQSITLPNGVRLELLFGDNDFRGLGKVSVGDMALRSGRLPMFVEIRNPSAIAFCNYTLRDQQQLGDGVTLEFAMEALSGGMMEWMVHEVRNRYNTADWTADPQPAGDSRLWLHLLPVNRTIGGREYVGFSYQYRYHSLEIPIYKILDRGSWEIGGCALGNEFWMRNCFVPSIVPITSSEQFHSTEWYLPDCANPNIFQFLPLQTELQGFSFSASAAGMLITWATEVAHIRSLFEKPRGTDELLHLHEHCADLQHTFLTAPVEVLYSAGDTDFTARANAYEAVRELVHETLHAQLGMRRERVTTYGVIEEWEPADISRYTTHGVPLLLNAGVKTIYVANHFENNMNVWGVSNMCCTVDYKVAESVGTDRLAAFCRKAHDGGARVEMWANTSVSTLTHIFHKQQGAQDRIRFLPTAGSIMEALGTVADAWVRNPSNALEADHYTPLFAVMNLRCPEVRAYWLACWEAARHMGLDGIFLDSSFNLSSDKFHFVQNSTAGRDGATADQSHLLGFYRPATEPPSAILSQFRAHLELMTDMQRLGYVYCNEDLGVFGIHRHGPGVAARLTSLPIWGDSICNFDVPALLQAGADPDDVFFRGLAYRMMWPLYWDCKQHRLSFHYQGHRGESDTPADRHLALLKAFTEVSELMLHREILPGELGVRYRAGARQTLWAFVDVDVPLATVARVHDILSGESVETDNVQAKAQRVYSIEERG